MSLLRYPGVLWSLLPFYHFNRPSHRKATHLLPRIPNCLSQRAAFPFGSHSVSIPRPALLLPPESHRLLQTVLSEVECQERGFRWGPRSSSGSTCDARLFLPIGWALCWETPQHIMEIIMPGHPLSARQVHTGLHTVVGTWSKCPAILKNVKNGL